MRRKKFLKRISLGCHPLSLTLLFLGIFLFFSYKLTSVPPGINIDESAIGFNAGLLSRTFMDENGRFLPVFFLTLGSYLFFRILDLFFPKKFFKERKRAYYFVLATLLITPLPLVLVGSIYRASRLMVYLPLFAFIATLGIKKVSQWKPVPVRNVALIIFSLLLLVNYFDFVNYLLVGGAIRPWLERIFRLTPIKAWLS